MGHHHHPGCATGVEPAVHVAEEVYLYTLGARREEAVQDPDHLLLETGGGGGGHKPF